MPKKPRVFSRDFKLMVVRRMLAGETVTALAREMKVLRKDLYAWRNLYRTGGAMALRPLGRPRKAEALAAAAREQLAPIMPAVPAAELDIARRRIAELERKIGQQQLDLDFFGKPCGRSRTHAGRAPGLA
jgi:transposase-like protein